MGIGWVPDKFYFSLIHVKSKCIILCHLNFNNCPRLTKLVRGLWNRLRTCACVCVRVSVLKILKFASSLSFLGRFWFCLFYLIGLGAGFKTSTQNFEISLIMQIYANLLKINEKCYFSVISWPILILFVLSDRAWCGLQNIYTEFWNSLIMQIYSKSMKNATSFLCHFLADFDSVCFIW